MPCLGRTRSSAGAALAMMRSRSAPDRSRSLMITAVGGGGKPPGAQVSLRARPHRRDSPGLEWVAPAKVKIFQERRKIVSGTAWTMSVCAELSCGDIAQNEISSFGNPECKPQNNLQHLARGSLCLDLSQQSFSGPQSPASNAWSNVFCLQ